MSESYLTQVIDIRKEENEKGTFLVITKRLKDGTTKENKVFGALMKKFNVLGWYRLTYNDDTHYLEGVEFSKAFDEGIPTSQAGSVQKAPISSGNGARSDFSAQKDRDIRGAVILKATVEYLASIPYSERKQFEPLVESVFDTFRRQLEAYVENKQPEVEKVPF